MANCIDAVLEKFPEADRKDLENVFQSMSKERKNGFLSGAGDAEFMKKAAAMLENYQRGVKVLELKTLENVLKAAKNDGFIKNPAFKSSLEGEIAIMTGTHKNIENARLSVDYKTAARTDQMVGKFLSDVADAKLPAALDLLKSGEIDQKIVMEKWELANGRAGVVTGDEHAIAIAKAWQNFTDSQLIKKNDAGAYINKLEGRVTGRVYDRNLMLKEGKDAFIEFMKKNLDYDRSFKRDFHTINADEALDNLWKKVTEGKSDFLDGDKDQSVKVIGAPANMARRLEQARSFHFTDAKAEYEFMRRFGGKTVAEDIAKSARQTARQVSLMEMYGTNPENAFRDRLKRYTPAEQNTIMRHWRTIDGSSSIPGKSPMAKWGASARKVADMQSLSLSVFAQVPDFATRAGLGRMGGESFASSFGESITSFFKNIPKENRAEVVHQLGVGAESMIGDFYDRNGAQEAGGHVFINKMHKKFFDLTGTKFVTETNEAATAQVLSSRLGYHSDKAFGNLDHAYARVLNKYGIGVPEWEVLRSATQSDGNVKMVGFGDVLDLDNGVLWDKLAGAGKVEGQFTGGKTQVAFAERFKRDLADKLSTYFRDRTDIAMNRAGGAERAAFSQRGHIEDSVEGQVFRFFSQFKNFSFTMANKFSRAYYHEVLQGQGIAKGASNVGQLMLTMTALGYVANTMRDMAKGKSPAIPQDGESAAKIGMEAMAKGGVGGIYGDYLFGEFDSRHGRSALSALAGPVAGRIDDTVDLWNQLKNAGAAGDPSKLKLSAVTRYGTNMILGNMAPVRQGLDYLFLNATAEALNPGYTQRMLQREEKMGQHPIAPWAVGYGEQ